MTNTTNNTVAPMDLAQFDGHTPGPWKTHRENISPDWLILTDTNGLVIANINPETGPTAASRPATAKMPQEHNARLIAAAPALLSELRTLRARNAELVGALGRARRCIDVSLIRNTPKALDIWESLADLIDAALAKQEGGAEGC
jgi:hypothetical protein